MVVTPAPAGGLGDQAMIDVIATEMSERYGGRVTLMPNPTEVRSDARMASFSGLSGKAGLAWSLARSRRTVIIGADIVDGAYGTSDIEKRFRLAKVSHRLGAKVRIVGCSFSDHSDPGVVSYLKASPWLTILARDPISKGRMEAALDREVDLVADTAFLLRPEATAKVAKDAISWMRDQKSRNRRILALNVSGLVFSRYAKGSLEAFSRNVAEWVGENEDIAVVVLAHDRRVGNVGDVASCDSLEAAIRGKAADRCHYVRDDVNAWDVKEIAGSLDMTFLCRMHFAIACLGRGVPPLSLVSMGKFEGLMDHFGLEGLMLEPGVAGDGNIVKSALDDLKARARELRSTIEAALPKVRELSARNFEGL